MPSGPTKGQAYTTTISNVQNSLNLRCTIGGSVRYPDCVPVEGQPGVYQITLDAADVTCPGPLIITEKVGNDEIERLHEDVNGCP